jgi:hypothetical protein
LSATAPITVDLSRSGHPAGPRASHLAVDLADLESSIEAVAATIQTIRLGDLEHGRRYVIRDI